MPGVIALVTAISSDVMAKMAAANMLPLVDGGIIIGSGRKADNSFAPRVIFLPKSSTFSTRSVSRGGAPSNALNPAAQGRSVRSATMTQLGGSYTAPTVSISAPTGAGGVQATATALVQNTAVAKVVITNGGSGYLSAPTITISDATGTGASAVANMAHSPQTMAIATERAVLTESFTFEVHCWGISGTASGGYAENDTSDYDATQALYQQVISSTHLLAAGVYRISGGRWMDYAADATVTDNAGHGFTFLLELDTPVLDYSTAAPSLTQAPTGVQPNGTLSFISPTGTVESGGSV